MVGWRRRGWSGAMLLLVMIFIMILIRLMRRMIGSIITFEVNRPGIDINLIHGDWPRIHMVKGVATAVAAATADRAIMMHPLVFDVGKEVAVWV